LKPPDKDRRLLDLVAPPTDDLIILFVSKCHTGKMIFAKRFGNKPMTSAETKNYGSK